MRRDSQPEFHAEDCRGGAVVICETVRGAKRVGHKLHTLTTLEYLGACGRWSRSINQVQPFATFAEAQAKVKSLREESRIAFSR